ncbi:MAG: hypothetical protein D6698_03205 [Gammaproteobacteria bacterium]|nr:MAG: hypothetical protein D6698_03205 [Gammaproteobacteria bacterium]
MNTVHRTLVKTRRRIWIDTTLRTLGWLAVVWVGLATLILLTDRLLSITIPMGRVWIYGGLGGLLILMAPLLALTRLPDNASVASMVDERLGLKDSLGTALFAESVSHDPFAKYVLNAAEQLASQARLNEAFPIRFGRAWHYAFLGSITWALMYVTIPPDMDLMGLGRQRIEKQQAEAQAEEAEIKILEANALLREVNTETDVLAETTPEDVFRELASLTQRDLTNPKLRQEAMSKLADVQDKLVQAEQAKQQQLRSIKNQMSGLDPGTRGPADRFVDAMRRGDFEAAQQELKRLAESLQDISEPEKLALQKQLQALSDQLEAMARQHQKMQQQLQQDIHKQLQQAGISQKQVRQLQQQGYKPQAVQQALQQAMQQQGMNAQQAQQQAQQIARQIHQQQQQAQHAKQSQSQCQGLGSSFGQMAQSLGKQAQSGQQDQSGQFQQGAWQGQQQLSQMQQVQQQIHQMQQAQQQLQQAMNAMNQSGTQQAGQSTASRPTQGGGVGGREAGNESGGNPIGQPFQTGPYTTRTEQDLQQGEGRIIASWQTDGELSAGQAEVEFDRVVTEARNQAERAVTEDRVPRRYHQLVKEYFQQLPDSPDQIRQAPAAPR